MDAATAELLSTIGKACPGCGNMIEKVDGCDTMMCGTTAHGKVLVRCLVVENTCTLGVRSGFMHVVVWV
jgi:hypothetical protein